MNGKGLCFFILSLLMAMVTPVTGQEGVADRLFGGAIVIDQGENKISLEPALARTTFQKQYASFVFPRLLDYDLQGNLIPVMIKSWEEDDSGEKITFHLYDFSIPSKVNRLKSGDLLESIKFLLRTNPLSPAAIILRDVAGVKDYLKGESELEGLEIIDQHTFVFHLEKPQPLLLHAFADINLAPSRFYDRPGLIATGMGAFTKSSLHLLKANLEFVSGRPFIDYILTSKRENIPPDGRRNVKILLDYVALYPEAQKTDGQLVFPGKRCYYLAINPGSKVLKRPEARLSLREIIDPDAMVEIFFADTAERLTSLIPASILPLNIQAIKTGSIPENRSGLSSKNRLVLGYETGNPRAKLVAERVKVDLLVKKYNVVLREVMSGNYKGCDLFVFQSLISKTAPEYSLWLMLHDLYKKTGNDIWLHKPIKGIYKWIANITRDFLGAGYLIPLFQEDVFISVDKRLKGVTFRPDGTLNLENSWISSDGK